MYFVSSNKYSGAVATALIAKNVTKLPNSTSIARESALPTRKPVGW